MYYHYNTTTPKLKLLKQPKRPKLRESNERKRQREIYCGREKDRERETSSEKDIKAEI